MISEKKRCRPYFAGTAIAFYFFSNEGHEPPHMHVDKAGRSCKFWLTPVRLALNRDYADH